MPRLWTVNRALIRLNLLALLTSLCSATKTAIQLETLEFKCLTCQEDSTIKVTSMALYKEFVSWTAR